ncbi:MAG TPA: alpha/beta fold hydrolase, partial [Candidatus Limnocylindria bacterium]|nr:alpha/beta fold hydrolase [Candidatus Limnocylindria bacterium]
VNVVRVGRGSPLLISGGPQLGHPYLRRLDALSDEHEIIYYDARGTGGSQLGDASQLTLGGAVEDLASLRAALGFARWSVLGHSLGGHVAYLYASAHPDTIQSLILVDTGPPLDEDEGAELWGAMQAKRTPEDDAELKRIGASDAFAAREPRAVERYILNIYTPFFRERGTVATLDLGFTEMTAANAVDYEDRLVASLSDQDPLGSLARVTCPTLVVHGEHDPIPVAFSRFLADRIADARLVVIPGGGHFPFIEEPEPFERAVREFLPAS